MDTNKIIKYLTASLYVVLYIIVATISCICSIDFFDMTHTDTASTILAISFEIGSMGCLFGAITTLKNKNNTLIWVLFLFLTFMQMMSNTYYAYAHIENYKDWVELFNLIELEEITQKRIISIISGCVLPLVSLSFVHLLVDLLKTNNTKEIKIIDDEKNYGIIGKSLQEQNNEPGDVYDAVPLTEEQKNEIKQNGKKSEIELAKEEIEKAIHKLEKYNKSNNG